MIEAIAVVLLSIASTGDSIPSPDDSVASSHDQLIESLWQCREIADDLARLECFDLAFLPDEGTADEGIADEGTEDEGTDDEGTEDEGSSETESPMGNRTANAENHPADGSTKTIAVIPAEGGKLQQGQSMELIVNCDDGEMSVYIDWGQYLSHEAPAVTVRIDSLPPSRSKWARSDDKHASFFKPLGGKKARQQKIASLVRELMAGQRLAARVIPRGQTAVTAVFDLSGAKTALTKVRRACAGWSRQG